MMTNQKTELEVKSKDSIKIDVRAQLVELNWCQGCILPSDLATKLFDGLTENDKFIILSQTCDIVHASFKTEPKIEILKIQKVKKQPSQYTYAKHPRYIGFSYDDSNYVASILDRYYIDRVCLLDVRPQDKIDSSTMHYIIRWIMKRYIRTAFPNEFDLRLKSMREELRKISLDDNMNKVTGIYIKFTNDELKKDVPYLIDIILTCEDHVYDSAERKKIQLSIDEIEMLFSENEDVSNIILQSIIIYPENAFSLTHSRNYRQWDMFESGSFENDTEMIKDFHS